MSSVMMTTTDWQNWDTLQWRRRIEMFGENDTSVLATGPTNEVDGIW